MILKTGIRFILWTGTKFLFFGRKDFRNMDSWITDLYGEELKMDGNSDFISLLPISCTVNNSVDGSGAASLAFIAPEGKYDFRFSQQSRPSNPWISKRDESPFRRKLLEEYVKPYKKYYEDLGTFNDEYLEADMNYTEPTFIFSPPQIIWIEMKRDDNDKWRRIFTGVVDSMREMESPGKSKNINITCSNLLQLTTRIPLCYERQAVAFASMILPQDPEFKTFWTVYMMSIFLDKTHIGFNPLTESSLSEIFLKFGKVINRSVGALSNSDYDELKSIVTDEGVIDALSPYVPTETDIDEYKEICKKYSFYRFKLFSTKDTVLDEGESNEVNDVLDLADLFKVENPSDVSTNWVYSVGQIKFNKIIKDLEDRDNTQQAGLPKPFQRVLRLTMGSFFKVKYVMMSNPIRKFTSGYGFMSHVDPFGNWIVEYPNFNALPKFGSGQILKDMYDNEIDSESIAYKDNDRKYIFQKFDCEEITHQTDPSSFVTYIELPMEHLNVTNLPEILLNKYMSRSWGTIEQIFQFGLNEVNMDTLYYNFGIMPKTDKKEWLYRMADMLRDRLNAEVWSASTTHTIRPDLQVGRTAVIIHKEKKYYVSSVSHNITVGRQARTSLGLTHGRNLTDVIVNPWSYFLDNVNIEDLEEVVGEERDTSIVTENYIIPGNYGGDSLLMAEAIRHLTGESIDPAKLEFYRKKLGPYIQPAAGHFTKESILSLDARILVILSLVHDKLTNWVQINLGCVDPPTILVSSAKRTETQGVQIQSRHCYGRAIDIPGVLLKMPYSPLLKPIHFDYSKPVTNLRRKLGDLMVQWFEEEGLIMNTPEAGTNDVVMWNFYGKAANSPHGGDFPHVRHIHASVGALVPTTQ